MSDDQWFEVGREIARSYGNHLSPDAARAVAAGILAYAAPDNCGECVPADDLSWIEFTHSLRCENPKRWMVR